MSQAKVDEYKKSKSNRKKEVKRKKIKKFVAKVGSILILLVLVGWAGHSIYVGYQNKKPTETVEVKYDKFNDYLNTLVE
ncbi:MAG TPA: hypothetical protein H9887_09330 [Candidatus Dorea intestinavium]|nr:hypothetical protein [Candidatus Dorea intestinavium]